ncbi:hypothetical protein Sam112_gp66 [Bacillus phage vB_BcM_Sam112]|uniref:Uncharacterized protein n=1 Tax=Bacillus phage vB_BcM_Sam112 TaxID=2663324 RepID=A0A5Q2F519_9CAUD|nr:hypothetical protein Sam112_gp66 [Bacillus phage vB_BcM_Sam112]
MSKAIENIKAMIKLYEVKCISEECALKKIHDFSKGEKAE